MTRALDLATLLDLILCQAMTLTGASQGIIYGWDDTAQVLMPQVWTDEALNEHLATA